MDQSSTLSVITQYVPAEYLVYVVISVVALVIFLLVMLFMYKLRMGRGSAADISLSFDDVSRLKEKGLLTEEEMKRVRAAMARRLAEQLKPRQTTAKPEALLYDPEVMALEEKARAKQAQMSDPATPSPQPSGSQAAPADSPAKAQLPSDIEALVQQGLITPEELATIRKRAAERGRPDA